MANSNSRTPNAAPGPPNVAPGGTAVSSGSNGKPLNGAARHVTPLDRLGQSERAGEGAGPMGEGAGPAGQSASVASETAFDAAQTEDERARALALYERGEAAHGAAQNTALDNDDTAMREFYARLVTLLTQDSEAEGAQKKGRGGLLTTLKRRWLPALLVAALTFYGGYKLLKPRQVSYSASTTLLLPPRPAASKADPFASPEDSYDTKAQLAIIGSEKIVRNAMSHVPPDLRKAGWGSASTQLAGVNVNATESNSLINITTSSRDPQASLRMVLEMVSAYRDYTSSRYSQSKDDNLTSTRQRVKTTAAALEKARRDLRQYKERTGIFDATSLQGSSSAQISELESALSTARREAATATAADPLLQSQRQRALDAGVALRNLKRDFMSDAPRVQSAQADFDRAQQQAEARAAQVEETSRLRISQLEQSLAEARAQAERLPAAEQQLNRLNQNLTLAESAFNNASSRADQIGLSSGSVAPTAKTLGAPNVMSDFGVKRARALAVAALGALLLGLICAIILDRLDHSVRVARDPEALFEAPILGALPAVRARGPLFIGSPDARGSARARTATLEACYNAQNQILGAAASVGARSILITSSLPEEGKSQCAANLAAAMAYGGRQVLLIDADFWHPSQNEILEQELVPGYVQVLRDEIPLSQAIRATSVANLHLLTAGEKVEADNKKTGAGNSAQLGALLSGDNHFHTLEVLKRFFDVIIVDAPPVMSVADAQLLSGLTDAVVLVAADHTNRDQVQRARAMLRLAGGVLLGVIINSVRLGEVQRWNVDFSPEEPFSNYNTALSRR